MGLPWVHCLYVSGASCVNKLLSELAHGQGSVRPNVEQITKQKYPKLGGNVCLPISGKNLFLAETFFLDGNVTLERDDFLGSSKKKLT